MLGFWNSANALSAAFFIDWAAMPALPAADSGRINPTLTWLFPTESGCCCGPAGTGVGSGLGPESDPRLCCAPEQAPSKGAPRIKPTTDRRVAPEDCDLRLSGPTITSLLLADRQSARMSPCGHQDRWIQAYCRRIVNWNKRIIPLRDGRRLQNLQSLHCQMSCSFAVSPGVGRGAQAW